MSHDQHVTGSQHNPGECDTNKYSDADADWCVKTVDLREWSEWLWEQIDEESVSLDDVAQVMHDGNFDESDLPNSLSDATTEKLIALLADLD